VSTGVKEVIDMYVSVIASISGVLQIYLFGSHANGMSHEKSDIDLLVVIEDGLIVDKMAISINSALIGRRKIPLDIVVNTLSAFNSAANEPTLQNRIKHEGVLLFA